jgi:cation-transporting ATPase E
MAGAIVESPVVPMRQGLSEAEGARRLAARGPLPRQATSRSYASIVRANVFTVFNLILAVFGAITLAYGQWQDALFLGVLVANTTIGIAQEVRAKRALDRLTALVAPTAEVVRDGVARELAVEDVVIGDLVRIGAGDQVVADGVLVSTNELRLDESILTGEARAVARGEGEEVRSGSFAVEGMADYEVSAVGPASYAARLTGEARSFRHPRSPLERALNRLLLALVFVLVPLGVLLGYALWERRTPLQQAVPTSVAAVVTLVPEGLILLASLAYAVAAMRMARRGALVQQLNAIEALASVDVVCLDKTGTLTEPQPYVLDAIPAPGGSRGDLERLLGRYAASAGSRTGTLDAIARAFPADAEAPLDEVPFSSSRRWSALVLAGESFVLGAPELFDLGGLDARAKQESQLGRRVVALGSGDDPEQAELLGLVVVGERLRLEARSTVEFLRSQGVEVRVLSGDRQETVVAIAREAGIPESAVSGRVSPEDKRRMVEDLQDQGRFVAMIGDGVNDVPALKAARLAIAQGSGAQMARSIADLVLVSGGFAAVPPMVAEGRKILRNLARVAKLFVTKSAFAVFLIVSIGLTPTAYPLLPRHLTLAASLTIGIPGFFLALAPSSGRFRIEGFLRGIFRFAVPAGTAAGLGVLSSYTFTLHVLDRPLIEARTVATSVLVIVGFYLLLALEASGRRRAAAVSALVTVLALSYAGTLLLPPARHFFALSAPGPLLLVSLAGAALAIGGLCLTDERFVPGKVPVAKPTREE